MLQRMSKEGGRAALAAFGLPAQPGLGSVGIKAPTTSPGLPSTPSVSSIPKTPSASSGMGTSSPKIAFNVGMGASTSSDGTGAQAGESADTGRRQRSVIDRALQRNEDDYATSSMPLPGDVVAP